MASDRTVGDYGQTWRIKCTGADPGAASSHQLLVTRPDGSRVVWPATVVVAGYVDHVFAPGELSEPGPFYAQAVLAYVGPPAQLFTSGDKENRALLTVGVGA